ncbi:MAG: hypothetical protein QOJ99_1417 [Bryobacterales bacterium]|nr:hypothetical protein [Bryobacterales bacterium]
MRLLSYVHMRNIVGSTGAGRVARQMTEALSRLDDIDLRVLADPEDHRRVVGATGGPWNTFRYHFLQNETSQQQARWYLFRSPRAESYWPEAQVIYCTAESYVPTRTARLVVTMHDAAVFEDGAHKKNLAMWKQRVKWGALFARLASEADLFHTVSQYSADRIAHYFPSIRSRLRVVHNAVTERFFEPITERGQRYLLSAGLANKRYVLAPGGLHHRKNADLILSAWPKIAQANPDVSLVIANHCDPAYEAGGSAMPRVLMTGHVGDDELCALYKAADVMWFPSRYEGFGLPVLEAMASGTAVLASDSSSLPEVAGGAALLMPPCDASKHVEAMTWLLRDENARRQLIAKGTGRVACFRWSNAARQLHSEFLQLI